MFPIFVNMGNDNIFASLNTKMSLCVITKKHSNPETIEWRDLRHYIADLFYYKTGFSLSSTNKSDILSLIDDVLINISRYLNDRTIINLTILNKQRCPDSLCGALLYVLTRDYYRNISKCNMIALDGLIVKKYPIHDIKLNKSVITEYLEMMHDLFSIFKGSFFWNIRSINLNDYPKAVKFIISHSYYFESSGIFSKLTKEVKIETLLDIYEETNSYIDPLIKKLDDHSINVRYARFLITTPKRYTFTDLPLLLIKLNNKELYTIYQSVLRSYYSKERLDLIDNMATPTTACGVEYILDTLDDKGKIFKTCHWKAILKEFKRRGYNRHILNRLCESIVQTYYYAQEYEIISLTMSKHIDIGATESETKESIRYIKQLIREQKS